MLYSIIYPWFYIYVDIYIFRNYYSSLEELWQIGPIYSSALIPFRVLNFRAQPPFFLSFYYFKFFIGFIYQPMFLLPLLPPVLAHPPSSERVRPPIGSQLSLAYQLEAGPVTSPASRLWKASHHRERAPKRQLSRHFFKMIFEYIYGLKRKFLHKPLLKYSSQLHEVESHTLSLTVLANSQINPAVAYKIFSENKIQFTVQESKSFAVKTSQNVDDWKISQNVTKLHLPIHPHIIHKTPRAIRKHLLE